MIKRVNNIIKSWFITEPVLFSAIIKHKISSNNSIDTIRSGQGRIEINENFVESLDDKMLELNLKFEVLRIILKHPYQRIKPDKSKHWIASSLSIQEMLEIILVCPEIEVYFDADYNNGDFRKKSMEWYYNNLSDLSGSNSGNLPNNMNNEPGDSDSKSGLTELWGEDELMQYTINDVIKSHEFSNSWGTISNNIKEIIVASSYPELDYRAVLRKFRATVISSQVITNRMRPSRRFGFGYPGFKKDFKTSIAIFVDVSGSMSNESISKGLGMINRFLKYGIVNTDQYQFDVTVTKKEKLKKGKLSYEVTGRGGTSFQTIFDYLKDLPKYDGIVIFTDGYAPSPHSIYKYKSKEIVWVFLSERHYNEWHSQHRAIGSGCFLK